MADGLPQSFAAVLDDLCRHPAGRRQQYTDTELAQLVSDAGGDLAESYISRLRRGLRDNPTIQAIEDLATALEVCPAAFVGGRKERLGEERPRRSFPGKLRHLFDVVHPPSRGPYTPEETARAISRDGKHGSISPDYTRALLDPPPGSLPNPRLKHLLGLADHFGLVDEDGPQAAYFLDDNLAATVDAELDDYLALRDAGVIELVTRMAEHAPRRSPQLRRQALDAVLHAVQTSDTSWVFSREKDDAQ